MVWKTTMPEPNCITRILDENASIQVVARIAREIMGDDPAHGWPHVERVARIADELVEDECNSIDAKVVALAIVLHDIGRFNKNTASHHAIASASMAARILEEHEFTGPIIEQVRHAILAHSWSLGVKAETIEAMIVSDADKIDALGATGIARVFHTGCQLGRDFDNSIKHFYEKIIKIPERLYLEKSKQVAKQRIKIIQDFLRAWREESVG